MVASASDVSPVASDCDTGAVHAASDAIASNEVTRYLTGASSGAPSGADAWLLNQQSTCRGVKIQTGCKTPT